MKPLNSFIPFIPAKFLLFVFFCAAFFFTKPAHATTPQENFKTEYIVVTGGPSLIEWEKFKKTPHDHWWANFVHASRIRLSELREQFGPEAKITWMVFRPSYQRRGQRQEKRNLLTNIESVRDKYKLHLVYFDSQKEFIDYLNHGQPEYFIPNRSEALCKADKYKTDEGFWYSGCMHHPAQTKIRVQRSSYQASTSRNRFGMKYSGQPRARVKIADLEYFGHSNRACFMFDYSNQIDTGSKACLHETELNQIDPTIFAPHAFIKSWGCHTGESMSKLWRKATGQRMIGAIGPTDYANSDPPGWHPQLSHGGSWSH